MRDDPRNQAGSTFESNIVVPRTAPSGGHYETSSALTWAANKAEAEDEWFFLTKLHLEWKETQPERNELYSKVRSMLQPKRSFEYYQGAYNMLIALMPVLSTIHQPNGPFRGHEEEAVQEVMQLVVGDTVGRMLDKWPADWIPKITDHGKPRATRRDQAAAWHRSRYADADADTGNGDDNSDNTNESDTDLVENEEGGGNEDR